MLILQSDYYDFNWLNSCLCFDVMLGMWIWYGLSCWWWNYMLKMCIYVYFVFLLKIDEIWCCCWWNVDEFMINCCCCYEMLLLMICTMGVSIGEVVVWNCEVCVKLFMWRTKMNFDIYEFVDWVFDVVGWIGLSTFFPGYRHTFAL